MLGVVAVGALGAPAPAQLNSIALYLVVIALIYRYSSIFNIKHNVSLLSPEVVVVEQLGLPGGRVELRVEVADPGLLQPRHRRHRPHREGGPGEGDHAVGLTRVVQDTDNTNMVLLHYTTKSKHIFKINI